MTLAFFKRRPVLIALTLLIVLAVVLVARKRPEAPAMNAPRAIDALEFAASDVVLAEIGPLRQVLPLSGTLRALHQVTVKAKVNAEVSQVLVRAGENVRAGQVLIRMDPSEYQARLEQARGSLVAARGQLEIASKTRDNNLALLDKGFISRNAFDNAASQFDIAKANVDTARGALDVARKALDDTTIRAPIDGTVSSRTIEPGEKVSTDNKLLDVVDLRQMELEAPVPTADILKVRLGQEVLVSVEGLAQAVRGLVVRINPATQAGSRSIMVYVRIDNPQAQLRAGMFADASLTLAQRDAVLTVPQAAIRQEGDGNYVYVIEDGKLARHNVTLGLRGIDQHGNAVEISSGLSNGARVIKTNLGNLPVGTPVRTLAASSSGAGAGAAAATTPTATMPSATAPAAAPAATPATTTATPAAVKE